MYQGLFFLAQTSRSLPISTLSAFRRVSGLGLGPMQSTRRTRLLLDEFARREGLPEVAEEGRGFLVDVFVAKERGDGEGGLFAVVEGDAAVEEVLVGDPFVGRWIRNGAQLTGRCDARHGTR